MELNRIERFYEKDTKQYELLNNEEFLKYFYEEGLDKEYIIEEIQQAIDFISYWYEEKYTERDLEYIEKYGVPDFKSMKKNLVGKTVDDLLENLPDKVAYFIIVETGKAKAELLQLIALKILYSERTTPERGFERAKIYINEFSKSMFEFEISSKYIDEYMLEDFERVKIADKFLIEEYMEMPTKEAEKLIKSVSRVSANNEDVKSKAKVFTKRLFGNFR